MKSSNIPVFGKINQIRTIAVLTGAGVSQESGLKTFRDNNGLWENYNVYDVATPEAWQRNPELVQRFYNERRRQLLDVKPNAAHYELARLAEKYNVNIITQNIDDLHERAGSTGVLHLHGELRKARSSVDENLIYNIDGWELKMGQLCERNSQLRPHVVWFGEMVPMIEPAAELVAQADLVLVVGTSLVVYPAAGLLHYARSGVPIVAIDPAELDLRPFPGAYQIRSKAGEGVKKFVNEMFTMRN